MGKSLNLSFSISFVYDGHSFSLSYKQTATNYYLFSVNIDNAKRLFIKIESKKSSAAMAKEEKKIGYVRIWN